MGASPSADRVRPSSLRASDKWSRQLAPGPRLGRGDGSREPGHVLQILQPDRGGVPAYVDNLARGLMDRGWRVTLAAPPRSVSVQRAGSSGAQLVPLLLSRAPHPTQDVVAVARLANLIRREKVDVVHAHSSKAGIVGAWAARLTRRGSVYTPHAWPFQMDGSRMMRAMYAGIERTHSRHCRDRIILVSHEERAAGARMSICPAEMMEVIHTGIPVPAPGLNRVDARRSLGIDNDAIVAAWVGRGSAQKRPEDVTPLQERLGANATILALGDGLDPYLGVRFSDAGGVTARPGTPVSTVYAAADLLVHTAAWEGLPLVVLEAMQMGLPVIAYGVGGIVEQVTEMYNGHLVDCGDVESLAGRVLTVAGDHKARMRMGIAARERTEVDFGYDQMVGQIEGVYERVYALNRDG
jgi:glycosyltransferase involved in cell wall biosynthesis